MQVVDGIWKEAADRSQGKLFDGMVTCLSSIEPGKLYVQPVPYRLFYAQRQSAKLRAALDLKALAVSGIIRCHGAVLFGKRSPTVTQYPGYWELVPSGALDAGKPGAEGCLDYKQQILDELKEECAVEPADVVCVSPLALILDVGEATYDICCQIELKKSPPDSISNDEYTQIESISDRQLSRFYAEHSGALVPTSAAILKYQGLI